MLGKGETPPRVEGQPWELEAAAKFLGVHKRTLTRAADTGKVKLIRFGRKVMLSDAELRRLAVTGLT